MDGRSKREVLEIFINNINQKNVFFPISFLQPTTSWSIIYDFLAKWSRDTSRELLTQCLYFKMLRTMSSLSVPNFESSPSSMPKL